ncbi:MAG TPA: hypothetical protein VEM96_14055 [Pyrinomonadaceae bacterium]|nr:hypothetical protein [Pyrinomonadaceae bacterium]
MKRCPKCNRTYTTGNQKFCTHDGGLLEVVPPSQSETIRISSQLKDTIEEAPTRAISRELTAESTGQFDPFKTVMARPEETTGGRGRNTQDLAPPSAPLSPAPTSASLPPLPSGSLPASDSGTLPSLPSAPLAPPPQAQGSGPIDTSGLGAQTLYTAAPPPPHSQPLPAPRPAKKSKLPLVLGILVVLLVFGVGAVAAGYFVVWPMLAKRTAVSKVEPQPQPSTEATPRSEPTPDVANANPPANEPPPYSPPANAVQFVNSSNNLDGKLAENYVDFSFYYPKSWQKDPTAGVPGATNFAKVERRIPPDFTQENFAVGSYSSAGSAESDRAVFHTLAENLSSQFAKKFPEYRKGSEGNTKAGVYEGYEFRFEGMSRDTAKGDLKLWGRVIFVPPVDGSKNGVTLLMLATSLAPELKNVKDVGVKGELPMLLESFRFGKK